MMSHRKRSADGIGATDPDADGILEALTDGRCRRALFHLVREGGRAELDDLARSASDDDRSAAIRLHHVVLPKLDDVGLLEYDYETNTAELAHPVSRVGDSLL